MKNIFYLLILAAISLSCNKNKPEYPKTYISTQLVSNGYKVFYDGTEIREQIQKDSLISLYKKFFVVIDSINIYGQIKATFENAEQVLVSNLLSKEEKDHKVINRDSITYWEESEFSTLNVHYLLTDGFFKYFPLLYEYINVSSPPNIFSTSLYYKNCYYVEDNGSSLSMPMMDYYDNHYYTEYKDHWINNTFNIEYPYNSLIYRTLIVHEYSIEFELE